MRLAIAALLVALPSVAVAGPFSAGVSFGKIKSKVDADSGADANGTVSVFGRVAFSPRLGGQLELSRIKTDDAATDIRTATALLVVELGAKGRLVPLLVAGVGIDKASSQYGYEENAHHTEGGLGLEYRADSGFVIGADLRIGGRTLEQQVYAQPLDGGVKAYVPNNLRDGEYRAARISLGLRF
jgi:hypothetical protein